MKKGAIKRPHRALESFSPPTLRTDLESEIWGDFCPTATFAERRPLIAVTTAIGTILLAAIFIIAGLYLLSEHSSGGGSQSAGERVFGLVLGTVFFFGGLAAVALSVITSAL